ncbi:hypothetical protein ACLD43_17510 [Clostridium botulinum]|uniref:hypothetical protein n=1 Tax=Clostridium botulinum TaxID=1491 RepID=UPI003A7FE46F
MNNNLVGVIYTILGASIPVLAQYLKDKSFKKDDITRRELNGLYLLKEEINKNKQIMRNILSYLNESENNEFNCYEINEIFIMDIWDCFKKDNILCIVDDKQLIEELFGFYMYVDTCITQHNFENYKIKKVVSSREVLDGNFKSIEFILKRIDTKIDKLYKKLK